MSDNYLITGYHGAPHFTAENDRGIQAGIGGAGRYVLPVGSKFSAEYIGNNTIRIHDGKLFDNGAAAGIPVGEYVDIYIPNAGQGMNRNDLIVFQYSKDTSTLVETGSFVLVQGTESSGTASDPTLTKNDLLSGSAEKDQMELYRISVSGAAIASPVQLFTVAKSMQDMVTGVKGSAESSYRSGNVNLTAANVGASPIGHTHAAMTGATTSAAGTDGMVPAPAAGAATRYLRSDGTWQVPPDTKTTVDSAMSDSSTNPAQNKVVKAYIDGIVGNVETLLAAL